MQKFMTHNIINRRIIIQSFKSFFLCYQNSLPLIPIQHEFSRDLFFIFLQGIVNRRNSNSKHEKRVIIINE